MAAEFVSRLTKDFERPGLPAIALTTDTSFLTAYTNDCGYEGSSRARSRRSAAPVTSCSASAPGNSANVIQAMELARGLGLKSVALTGAGGRLAKLADVAIAVPCEDTQHIQEAHLAIEHRLCLLVEQALFGRTAQ
jgi:D-sedoheptulose 7-phosphate isomerase